MTVNIRWLGLSVIAAFFFLGLKAQAATEALDWNTEGQKNVTCIYGKITVLATTLPTYFCGAEWWGVDGYCGIQDISQTERRAIFSIWDTTPQLHPSVTEADPDTISSDFHNEGQGAHTHIVLDWKLGETIQFFVEKTPGASDTTNNRFYIVDLTTHMWRHLATVNSPNGPNNRGATFDGVMSWIENIGGQSNPAIPKVALCDLWIGSSPATLKRLIHTGGQSGSGRWGKLGDTYFLAEGSPQNLATFFTGHDQQYGSPVFGVDGKELPPLAAKPLPTETVRDLENLPQAPTAPMTPPPPM